MSGVRPDHGVDDAGHRRSGEKALEPVDVVVAAAELGIVDEALVQRDRRLDAADHVFGQRAAQAHHAFVAARAVDDQLGDQAVVVGRHRVAR